MPSPSCSQYRFLTDNYSVDAEKLHASSKILYCFPLLRLWKYAKTSVRHWLFGRYSWVLFFSGGWNKSCRKFEVISLCLPISQSQATKDTYSLYGIFMEKLTTTFVCVTPTLDLHLWTLPLVMITGWFRQPYVNCCFHPRDSHEAYCIAFSLKVRLLVKMSLFVLLAI